MGQAYKINVDDLSIQFASYAGVILRKSNLFRSGRTVRLQILYMKDSNGVLQIVFRYKNTRISLYVCMCTYLYRI